jgi:transketolase
MRDQAAGTVTALMDEDDSVALVLAEISTDQFARAMRDHPDRAVNVGIMEQTMIGVAAGLALEGFLPVAHSITPFLVERPLEQIKLDLGNQELGGILISTGGSYDYSTEGTTHHSPGDVELLLSVPGMAIWAPGSAAETDAAIRAAHARRGLGYIRLGARQNAEARPDAVERIVRLREGQAGTVLAVGPMLDRTRDAVEGLDVTLLYTAAVRPFDTAGLNGLAAPGAEVVVIEPFHEGTTAALVSSARRDVPSRFLHIGVPRRVLRGYGEPADLDREAELTREAIRRRISGFLRD